MSRMIHGAPWLRAAVSLLAVAAILGVVALWGGAMRSAPQGTHGIPAPTLDQTAGSATSEVAVFAGGCFWGVQGVYKHVKGVGAAKIGELQRLFPDVYRPTPVLVGAR